MNQERNRTMSNDAKQDFLRRAAAVGMTTEDAMLMSDLATLAARNANTSIKMVVDTAPTPALALNVQLNAIWMLHSAMMETLADMGPLGQQLLAQFKAAESGR